MLLIQLVIIIIILTILLSIDFLSFINPILLKILLKPHLAIISQLILILTSFILLLLKLFNQLVFNFTFLILLIIII